MSDVTARLGLPLLQPGQAQKEMTHNEALTRIDLTLAAAVVAAGVNAPPAAPVAGQCWIVGDAPTGDWTGQGGAMAGWTEGGWRFVVPPQGFATWDQGTQAMLRRSETGWEPAVLGGANVAIGGQQVVGARQPAIDPPTGGSAPDHEARAAITAILETLRTHGLIAR